MRCRKCDLDNLASNKLCSGCGTELDVCCPKCQQPCPANAVFCSWCGSALSQVSSALADGAERKQATILFVDIVASTQMIAGLDAEQAMGRLRPALAAMSRAARRFGGTILQSLGDGLKVAFGAPRALEGHAILACRAALAMQEAVLALDKAPVLRIGLHSGEVVAGEFDTGCAVEQEAQGITVHIASRIEQLAEPGSICISDACYQLVRAFCDTLPMKAHALKGVPKPMEVHKLIGLRPAVSSEQFRNAELTPFQSRHAELAILDHALAEALRGAPGVVGISAAAGVGKSRLCFEFGERCRRRSVFVLEVRCFVHGQATPMLPIIEMLRNFFRISPLDPADGVREKVSAKLRLLDPPLLEGVSLLFGLLGVRDASDPPASADPRVAQEQLRGILGGMIKAAGREPGVVIFEDLHWLDPVSGNLLEAMIEAAAGTHTLILLNFRAPLRAPWMEIPRYRALVLEELGGGASDALVGDLLGAADEVGPLRAQIVERCAGNPFFAEELVRSLAETDLLVGTRGNYRPGAAAPTVVLPATVEAVIGARIDRLPEHAKALLQVGATIGKEFPVVLLGEITSMPPEEMDAHLAQLCEAGLIQQNVGMFGRSFGFRHPLIQEVGYAMQLRARRRLLHAEVAKAIEKFPWGRLDEIAGDLARHCESAGDLFAAATHLRRSAFWTGRTDAAQALQQWKKVHALLESAPRSAEIDRLRAEACGGVLGMGWKEGIGASEAKPYAEEALHYAREVGDPVQGPLLRIAYGRIVVAGGPADEYVELCREALSNHANAENDSLNALVHGAYAQSLFYSGRLRESLRAIASGLELLQHPHLSSASEEQAAYIRQRVGFDVGHWLHALRTLVLVWLGRFADADAAIADMQQFKDNVAVVQFIPHLAATDLAYWREDPIAGQYHAGLLAHYAASSRLPFLRVTALIGSGKASSAAHDFDAALKSFREALTYARRTRAGLELEPPILSMIADVTCRSGAPAEAAGLAAAATELARERTNRVAECHASLVRATALLGSGSHGSAGETEPLIARAEQLIEISGAAVFEPMLKRAQRLVSDHPKREASAFGYM
jgi:class 3 adenylate cyclase/tetratricopeptide (TPR) repeat protein